MRASLFGFDVDLRDHIDPIEICGLAPELDASRAVWQETAIANDVWDER